MAKVITFYWQTCCFSCCCCYSCFCLVSSQFIFASLDNFLFRLNLNIRIGTAVTTTSNCMFNVWHSMCYFGCLEQKHRKTTTTKIQILIIIIRQLQRTELYYYMVGYANMPYSTPKKTAHTDSLRWTNELIYWSL